jgi:hypothetical protein
VERFAWGVLTLVFLDEVLATVAFGVWGWQVGSPRWILVWLLPILAMAVWSQLASPKARFGGGGRREVAKVAVFGLASWGLWDAGHHPLAIGFLVFSVVVNGLALIPEVAEVAPHG